MKKINDALGTLVQTFNECLYKRCIYQPQRSCGAITADPVAPPVPVTFAIL